MQYERFFLYYCRGRLEGKHMRYIAYFLKKHPEIISVDFSYNNFGDKGIKYLADIYFSEENDLLDLNLMHCDITATGIEYLASSKNVVMQHCRLNGNKIGALVNSTLYIY